MSGRAALRTDLPRPRARGRELLLAGVVFAVCALGFGARPLLVVGLGLVAAVVTAWFLVLAASSGLRLRRTVVERRPRAGDDVHVDVGLSGTPRARSVLRFADWEIAPGVGSLGSARIAGRGHGGRRLRIAGARRGEHVLDPARMTVADPLGLVAVTRHFRDAAHVLVVPRTVAAATDAQALGDRRQTRHATLGEDIAHLEGIREYRPGDPLSRVHWGQTAKRGALQTKVFRTDESGGFIEAVLVDVRDATADPDAVELAVTAAASMMQAATSAGAVRGRHIQLWAGTSDAPVPCAWADAEARLARLEQGDGPALEDMLRRSLRLLPHGAGVVGVTTTATAGMWDAARAARRRGVECVLVLVGEAATAPATDAIGVPVVRARTLAELARGLAPPISAGHRRGGRDA